MLPTWKAIAPEFCPVPVNKCKDPVSILAAVCITVAPPMPLVACTEPPIIPFPAWNTTPLDSNIDSPALNDMLDC